MIWARFYSESLRDPSVIQPGVGDRSVIILDGRERRDRHLRLARETAMRRGYQGYAIMHGPSILRSAVLAGPFLTVPSSTITKMEPTS